MLNGVKFKDQFSRACVHRGLRLNTERSYWDWARKFIRYTSCKSVEDMLCDRDAVVSGFLTAEAQRGASVSTQSQALNALNFTFSYVLKHPLGKLGFKRPTKPARLPAVPVSHDETMKLLDALGMPMNLICRLIYGSALRVNDCLRLRIRDLDFDHNEIRIMDSKGGKDRLVPMPAKLRDELMAWVTAREAEHLREKRNGSGWVHLPGLYGEKNPKAHYDTAWQYLFPSRDISTDPRTGNKGRHHVTAEAVQTAMRKASAKLKLKRNVTPHGLRHSAARRMREKEVPIHTIQQVLGHADVNTTMRYLGLGEAIPQGISPLD